MLQPQSCVSLHRNDNNVPALVLRPFNVWHWTGLRHRRVSPQVFLVHFPCHTAQSHLGDTAQSWSLLCPHLQGCSLKGTLLAKPILFRHVHGLYLSKSSNWLITRFFSSWTHPLTPFKRFEINAFLGVVPTPAYLSSLSLQLLNVLCQPKEYFSSVSKSKDKVSFCFLRVWPVIGVLCIKFISLLSSVWVLNWVLVFFLIHTREA